MVCDRVIYRSWIQMLFFFGYMCGSIFFGILADRFVSFSLCRREKRDVVFRYGRRPVMGVSFFLMSLSSLICALTPGKSWSFAYSYSIFILGRFCLACSTRGVSVSAFVLSSEIGECPVSVDDVHGEDVSSWSISSFIDGNCH